MPTKTEVNKVLKEAGLDFVKASTGSMYDNPKCLKDHDNKRIKGIYCWSHSPMDVTSVGSQKVAEKEHEVHSKVAALLGRPEQESGRYVVSETSRSITYLSLRTERYRSYLRSANLDEGYQSSYIVPYFVTEKK